MILGYGDYPGAWEVHNKLFTSAGCHGGILHPPNESGRTVFFCQANAME
jgi:hypothetical protein